MVSVAETEPTFKKIRTPGWLFALIAILTVFNALPFLAPVFMKLGWEGVGRALYLTYGPFCHQMAQRSFFLFGPEGIQMYNLADLPVDTNGMTSTEVTLAMRRFLGNEQLGWKVAWSDRMVYMYMAPLLVAIAYAFMRRFKAIQPLPVWLFPVLLLPMAIDGGTHMLSDLTGGVGQGFRYTNEWLATLTSHRLPTSFYTGDAFGSFNSLMRLISGIAFGIAVGGLLYPFTDLAAPSERDVPRIDKDNAPVASL